MSVSDKYDSVNERTQEISQLIKLHIQGVWQNAHKFISQLAHTDKSSNVLDVTNKKTTGDRVNASHHKVLAVTSPAHPGLSVIPL